MNIRRLIIIYLLFILSFATLNAIDLQQFDEQFDKNISDKIENNQALKDALDKIDEDSQYEEYGGEPGKNYFKIYNESVIQPTLLALINKMKEAKDDDPELFIRLLYKLGQERGKIDDTVAPHDFRKQSTTYRGQGTPFGKMDTWRISDTIGAYPAWKRYLQVKMTSQPPFGKLVKVDSVFIGDNEKILLNSEEYAELPNRLREVFHGSVEKSKGGFQVTGEDSQIFGIMSIPVEEIDTQPGKREYYLSIGNSRFHHRDPSSDELKKLIAPYFYKALNSSNKEDLINSLGILLLRMSHQTIYARGQAGMTLWVLHAVARINGYELKFPPEWKGPKYPNPDMYALSYFNEDKFLEEFKKNVVLEPIVNK